MPTQHFLMREAFRNEASKSRRDTACKNRKQAAAAACYGLENRRITGGDRLLKAATTGRLVATGYPAKV
jgi:hypothetical protein